VNAGDPHRGQPVIMAGASPGEAKAAMILVHGRGADARDIIGLAEYFGRPDIAYVAPEAAGHSWYPNRFLVPVEENEPYLSSALGVLASLIADIGRVGIGPERLFLLGFSQGACLSLEFAARNPRRYGGVIALSGGLIGASVAAANYPGSLAGTPVFLGCSDVDPHIPLKRVKESSAVMTALGAAVTEQIYPGMGHTITGEEVEAVVRMLAAVA
jgi:predicted esterase